MVSPPVSPEEPRGGVVLKGSLQPAGPLERIDRAFVLVRRGGFELAARAWLAGAVPALAVLAYFFAERVEGVGVLRLPAAAAIVAAFLVRSWVLSGVARVHVRALSDRAPIAAEGGGFLSVARTASVVGWGLWVWAWGLLVVSGAGPIGVALFLPWLALRGLAAPSWLARAGCTDASGWRGYAAAFRDTTHQRLESMLVEGLVLTALFGLAANLYGVFAVVVLVGRSFLGLEMALVDEFLSLRNTFVLLGVALVAAAALEPLRAALSAQVYVEARVRAEGLDLRAALEEAIRHTGQRVARTDAGRVALAVAAFGLASALTATGLAQPLTAPGPDAPPSSGLIAPAPSPEQLAGDAQARAQARDILDHDVFRDVEARRRDGVATLISRAFEALIELFVDTDGDSGAGQTSVPSMPLPGPTFFLVLGGLLVLCVGVFLVLTRRRAQEPQARILAVRESTPDPRDRSPDDWLGEATALAALGRHGEALRALYLATLVALDRRAWIRFEPSLTNWQYLRQLPSGSARDDFRALTRTFDRMVYGEQAADADDYARSRALAERILSSSRAEVGP